MNKPLYDVWHGIIRRCTHKHHARYKDYGGRGIRVCERWLTFENFVADMSPRPDGACIERKDNDGHYEPNNCCWSSAVEQANNRRSSKLLTFNGETLTLALWSKRVGLKYQTILHRIDRLGWSIESALTIPRMHRGGLPVGWKARIPMETE